MNGKTAFKEKGTVSKDFSNISLKCQKYIKIAEKSQIQSF